MKNAIITILVIILWIHTGQATTQDTSTHNPTEPQMLTVVASSGLTLRKAPDLGSPAIKIIPYGEAVTVRTDQPDTIYYDRIDWVDGEWIVVEHGGNVGFVFDGFLTSLPLPSYTGEYSPYGLELIYPLETWMAHHHLLAAEPDTIIRTDRSKVVHNYVDGHRMIQSNQHDYYKVEVYLHNVRLMEVYHLLRSMLDDPGAAKVYEQSSTFLEDSSGDIYRIKIQLDDKIDIRMVSPDLVRIQMISVEQYCKL